MIMTFINNLDTKTGYAEIGWLPTARLRFVEREGKKILQQVFFRNVGMGETEWRDIPLEAE